MDQERPRSYYSINSRNDLRKLLHLEFLYKENKTKEKPLRTNLELITSYFLDYFKNTAKYFPQGIAIPALSVTKRRGLSDEDAEWRASLSEKNNARPGNLDGDVLGNFVSSRRPPHKSIPNQMVPDEVPSLASLWEMMEEPHASSSKPSMDVKIGEKTRQQSGLIAQGMMTGPIATSPQDTFHKHFLSQSLALSSTIQIQEEQNRKGPDPCLCTLDHPMSQEVLASSNGSTSRGLLGQFSELTLEKPKTTSSNPPCLPSKGLPQPERARPRELSEDSPAVDSNPDADRTSLKVYQFGANSRMTRKRQERAFKRQYRKNQLLASNMVDDDLGAMRLEDVEDELREEGALLSSVQSVLEQISFKPINLSLAKEIKTLLFGSTSCCFNEEWKLQSFSFNNTAPLKYGIVQNKGGPCGVLAAVQGCVLQKLLFEGERRANCAWRLDPSDAHRTHCLVLAIADIVWRAGDRERAVITLASETEQFSPAGKYKADGVLETVILYNLTCYEELVTFLQHSIHQFEAGPYGCILLTLSAILSRSVERIRQDFDVPTNFLIGRHGYCTQELVNLLLTGRAVSNVFNDVLELDSGNGNITVLKGIFSRSDIGFLSLFEHYNVCQVGCFLKTPRFPIWVVCSESHFSVLFSLKLELLRDLRTQKLFDLYYYDGLANQQEQIRLTIDTTRTILDNRDSDLIPPLELCIRTKWKGALVNWNNSDPIL
ncbi:probable ubiquitin carboxyl-terminal hydrolase MINDY-4 [Carlito syrichta]|uniref:Ubiquitin carboxyl-terminal hydrolase MINDY n=1 Tax=Carlito syrichta TaxID=1868482 RepID=A0A3Q0DNZ6_CARSF|nr:probable ubiquitin carboxyl-terminal hydrolase MINDY-4 [Carlito syrichta]